VFRQPSVQFRLLLGGQRELGLALGVGEAVPQRHGDLDPLTRGELEQLSESVRQHA